MYSQNENPLNIHLNKHEIDLICKALDTAGDMIADREGYSSGEEYWDLKTKLEAHADKASKQPSLEEMVASISSDILQAADLKKDKFAEIER